MGTPLYTTDIIPLTSRPTLTVMDDGDYFVILDTSTGKISKILRTNVQKALSISYDNATSGLTATQVQAALDELVVNLGSSDSAISALGGRLDILEADELTEGSIAYDIKQSSDALKGVGYTDGTLKTHEDRLDTLEGADTVEGSVAKTVKDAVDPIEARLDTTELTLARQGQDLASVKQTLHQGNGATLDFSGIGSVALDARATGRANPTVEGRTATNIVDGAGIANLGTVTFASVLNHKYFDVLHGTILTGTGSDMTITNDTGATADIAVINLTSIFGAGNEPSASDCAKIFSYFDGTKSIQLPARVRSVSEDESETSTIYIADNEEVRSVPAISDEVKVINGQLVKVQNVQRHVLQTSDIIDNTSAYAGVTRANTGAFTDALISEFGSTYIADKLRVPVGPSNYIPENIGNYAVLDNKFYFILDDGLTLEQCKTALAGTVIYYQLATPIITPLTTSGTLKAFQNGSVYYEPYYEGSHQTDASSEITLPYEGTIEAVYGYDENLTEYLLDSSEYSLTGTTLTITGALENEVFFVQMSRSEPLAPEMSVNTLNNEQVTLDSADGKYYQIGFTTTNGVPTVTATEVV